MLHKLINRPKLSQRQDDQNGDIRRYHAGEQQRSHGNGSKHGLACTATYSLPTQIADE